MLGDFYKGTLQEARSFVRSIRWPRPPRRAIPTAPGLFALIAPTILGLAAVTATNNLLFLLLGASLGSIVLSGILSEQNIQPVRVYLRPLSPAYAGQALRIEVQFKRSHKSHPAFDLRFKEASEIQILPSWKTPRAPPDVLDARVEVMEGQEARVVTERIFLERGRVELPTCEISTRYPFGLLVKSKDVFPTLDLWVRPKRVECPSELMSPPGKALEDGDAAQIGLGTDIYGLRERTDRDAIHRIHALRSLSLGKEVVLEMSDVNNPTAELGVATGDTAHPEAFERTLEYAQAIMKSWSERGFAVGLVTYSQKFSPSRKLEAAFDHLAQVKPSALAPVALGTRHGPRVWLVPQGVSSPSVAPVIRVSASGEIRADGGGSR